MYVLTNKDKHEVGFPAPKYGAVILNTDETKEVSDQRYHELMKLDVMKYAINSGLLGVEYRENQLVEDAPERGVKLVSKGGGWWIVLVNGYPVSDTAVRKDEAERIAEAYE